MSNRQRVIHFGLIIGVVFLAGFLRFYQLGKIPPSLDWDEVSLGYNAWSLLETGKDEFGNSWPLSIRSFGDYKPPLYVYLLMPSLRLFGRTEFAVRFPSAFMGMLAVVATYFLANELIKKKLKIGNWELNIGLIASFLLAISPWHLQFSRIAFESNVGLSFFVVGAWLFLRWVRLGGGASLLISTCSFSAAMMTYHSFRVAVPLLVIGVMWFCRRSIFKAIRQRFLGMLLPLAIATITVGMIGYVLFIQGVGQARLRATSFLTIANLLDLSRNRIERFSYHPLDRLVNHRFLVYGRQWLTGYLDHFDLRFWFLDGDRINNHRTPSVGLLYWWELPFLIAGMLVAASSITSPGTHRILWWWFFIAPLASSVTGGTPSAVRSLVFLPTFQVFISIGLMRCIDQIGRIGLKKRLFLVSCFLFLVSFEIFHYLHQYYTHSSIEYAKSWQYGYKEMIDRVLDEKEKFSTVFMTTTYDQPYIFVLWYGNYAPGKWTNDGEFNKRFDVFQFSQIDRELREQNPEALFIGTARELGSGTLRWTVDFPDGSPAFVAAGGQ